MVLLVRAEQDVGGVGHFDDGREGLAVRVVDETRAAVRVEVEAERAGVAGQGHRARRARGQDPRPVTGLAACCPQRPVPDRRRPFDRRASPPGDEGGAGERRPHDGGGRGSHDSTGDQPNHQNGQGCAQRAHPQGRQAKQHASALAFGEADGRLGLRQIGDC